MFNLRTVATQNCNNPTFVKNFIFHIFRATNIHKFHSKGTFPIKRPIANGKLCMLAFLFVK